MIEKLHNALFTDDDILFFDEDSGNARFFGDEMGILNLDLNDINFDYTKCDEDHPETVIGLGQ